MAWQGPAGQTDGERKAVETRACNLITAFQYLKGDYKHEGKQLFTWQIVIGQGGTVFKLKEKRSKLDIRGKFCTEGMVRCWKRLPREVVDAPSLEVFKARLDGALGNLV